jgi:cytochrome c556
MRLNTWFGALCLIAFAGTALAQANVITERRAGLKRAGEAMDQMKLLVENKGDPRPAVRQIDEMIGFFTGMPKLFPAGSDKGDTKAKPEIWQNFSDFEAIDMRLVGHLKLLRNAAEGGDVAAFEAAYKATGPQFCGSCHRPYRNR